MKEIAYSRFMSASVSAPEANEAIAHAVIKPELAAGPGLTPVDTQANKIRVGLYGDGAPPRSILEEVAASDAKKTDGKAMGERIDKTFDADADKDLARAFDAFTRKLIDEGYDDLDAVEKLGASGKVLEALGSSGETIANILNGLTPAEKNAIAEEILKNPDFIAHAKAVHGDVEKGVDGAGATAAEDAKLEELEEARYQAERARNKAARKRGETDRRIRDARKLEDRYSNTTAGIDPSTGLEYGDKRIELEAASSAVDAISTDPKYADQLTVDVQGYKKQITDLEAMGYVGAAHVVDARRRQIEQLKRDQSEAERKISEYNTAVDKRDKLIAERDSLPTKIEQLEEDLDQADEEVRTKEKAYSLADTNFQEEELRIAEAQRTHVESRTEAQKQLLDNLENVLYKATKDWLKDYVGAAQGVNDEIDEKEASEAKDKFKKGVLDQMKTRYKNKEGKFKKRSKAAEGDFDMLIDESLGPKTVLTEYLMRAGYEVEDPPGSGNMVLSPEGAEKMKEEAFVKEMTDKLTVRIVREKMKNGKLNKAELLAIEENDEIKAALTKAIEEEDHYKHRIAELKAKGIIPKDFGDHLKTVAEKKSFWLIFMTVALGLPGFMAGRAVLKGGGASAH